MGLILCQRGRQQPPAPLDRHLWPAEARREVRRDSSLGTTGPAARAHVTLPSDIAARVEKQQVLGGHDHVGLDARGRVGERPGPQGGVPRPEDMDAAAGLPCHGEPRVSRLNFSTNFPLVTARFGTVVIFNLNKSLLTVVLSSSTPSCSLSLFANSERICLADFSSTSLISVVSTLAARVLVSSLALLASAAATSTPPC